MDRDRGVFLEICTKVHAGFLPSKVSNRACFTQLCLQPTECCQWLPISDRFCAHDVITHSWTKLAFVAPFVKPSRSLPVPSRLQVLARIDTSGLKPTPAHMIISLLTWEKTTLYVHLRQTFKVWMALDSVWWSTCEANPEAYPRNRPPKHTPQTDLPAGVRYFHTTCVYINIYVYVYVYAYVYVYVYVCVYVYVYVYVCIYICICICIYKQQYCLYDEFIWYYIDGVGLRLATSTLIYCILILNWFPQVMVFEYVYNLKFIVCM